MPVRGRPTFWRTTPGQNCPPASGSCVRPSRESLTPCWAHTRSWPAPSPLHRCAARTVPNSTAARYCTAINDMVCVNLYGFMCPNVYLCFQTKMVQHIRKKHPEYQYNSSSSIQAPLATTVISSTPAVITTDGTTAETVVVSRYTSKQQHNIRLYPIYLLYKYLSGLFGQCYSKGNVFVWILLNAFIIVLSLKRYP